MYGEYLSGVVDTSLGRRISPLHGGYSNSRYPHVCWVSTVQEGYLSQTLFGNKDI
jgi:hypothetical protein